MVVSNLVFSALFGVILLLFVVIGIIYLITHSYEDDECPKCGCRLHNGDIKITDDGYIIGDCPKCGNRKIIYPN